jgi:hypothetical protein
VAQHGYRLGELLHLRRRHERDRLASSEGCMNDLVIKSCANPRWTNAEHLAIDCVVTIANCPYVNPHEAIRFAAMANDPEPHGRKLWDELVAGKHGPIAEYLPPPKKEAPHSAGTIKL